MSQAFRSTRVLTSSGLGPAMLMVKDGSIAEIRPWEARAEVPLRDFGDLIVLPGLVDPHVHINDPGRDWEGFATATRAAASGGVTSLIDMPLNCAPETVELSALEAKRAASKGNAWVDWATWGGVVPGNADSLLPLAAAGVPGFKCFLIDSGIKGFPSVSESDIREALGKLKSSGLTLLAHAEVVGPIETATRRIDEMGADWRRYSTYLASRPDSAEVEAIELLIRIAEEFGARIHIVHLATAEALQLIADARQRGVAVSVETCIHYLWFAAEEIPDGATEFKCAPPIRSRKNREMLWKALESGQIDMVATDHSPCLPAMKRRDEGRWDLAWGGVASLGLALPVLWTGMRQRGYDLENGMERIGRWMASEPARLAGLTGRKGALLPGADADFTVFDPDAEWTVTEASLHFRHKLSPYLGAMLRGRVEETWLHGQLVYGADRDSNCFVDSARGIELVRKSCCL